MKYVTMSYDGCSYLTAGRKYNLIPDEQVRGGIITNDDGDEAYILFEGCDHINGNSWTLHVKKQEPKTWGQMTDEEKGALLLAKHEGKVIECWQGSPQNYWLALYPQFDDSSAYRVKPESVVKIVELYGWPGVTWNDVYCGDTHRITFETKDGEPDVTTIAMSLIENRNGEKL